MPRIDDLIDQIRVLEEEMQTEYAKKRDDFGFAVGRRRVLFSEQVAALQRESKSGLLRYVARASWLMGVTAPVIYLGIVPMLLLDAFLFIYQSICFPVYGIAKARRAPSSNGAPSNTPAGSLPPTIGTRASSSTATRRTTSWGSSGSATRSTGRGDEA